MRAFIDFEASSLGPDGYPIEVAWVFEDGRSASFLIAPIDGWTDWNPAAEGAHGISRAQLAREGVAASLVARHLVDELAGHQVLTSAPSWDARWMSRLLCAGGLPRCAVRVADTDAALLELAAALLAPVLPSSQVHRASRQIMASAGDRFVGRRRAHRPLADAELERDRWLTVCRLARAYAGLSTDDRAARPPAASREANLFLHPRVYPRTSLDRPGAEWRAS